MLCRRSCTRWLVGRPQAEQRQSTAGTRYRDLDEERVRITVRLGQAAPANPPALDDDEPEPDADAVAAHYRALATGAVDRALVPLGDPAWEEACRKYDQTVDRLRNTWLPQAQWQRQATGEQMGLPAYADVFSRAHLHDLLGGELP